MFEQDEGEEKRERRILIDIIITLEDTDMTYRIYHQDATEPEATSA